MNHDESRVEQPGVTTQSQDPRPIIRHVSRPLHRAAGWMKFLAVMSMLSAIYSVALRWWTIFWMWIPVWIAVLLWQSANAARRVQESGDDMDLRDALGKLRLYFLISGVLALLGLLSGIAGLLFALPHLG
jgi:Fe2+ transport system protein B